MADAMRPGDVLAGRYRLVVLLHERSGGRFWRAYDTVLARDVAIHLIPDADDRAKRLREAARRSANVHEPRLLRVLDTDTLDGQCYVVNEWGEGISLNNMVVDTPLAPRRAAWLVSEAADSLAVAHRAGVSHGRLVPENVLVDESGAVKLIGFAVDAALHGLPTGDAHDDVAALGAILYTALTGKWPGHLVSGVPAAPLEHGHALRPRQVRAGVPRVLDQLCDDLLSGHRHHRHLSAQALRDALVEFVGDTASVAAAEAERMRGSTSTRQSLLPTTAPVSLPVAEPEPEPEPTPEPEPVPEPIPGPLPEPADETQAGVPVFYDHIDDVGWLAPSDQPPPPPPPFEEQPARPLFAPDPPDGRSSRPARGETDDAGNGFWPWEDEPPRPAPVAPPATEDAVPGRNWLRVAGILAVSLLLLVALVYAFNRGRDGGSPGSDDADPTDSGSPGTGSAVTVAAVDDFDPFGDTKEENSDEAPLVIDGKPGTTWHTQTYRQNFGPGGLKPGVGLVLDLGEAREVRSVTVTLVGGPTTAELRTVDGSERPTGIDGLEVVATRTATGTTLELTPEEAVTSRYLVLWLTSVPAVTGGFRGEVAEVEVTG